ncbi:MAG TPA: prephenate dehydratase domain-containing protein [Gaiellaceae bacterium]|nr:prephenate dehydratase domain-containing protein [Gaiellaceae bacterium]
MNEHGTSTTIAYAGGAAAHSAAAAERLFPDSGELRSLDTFTDVVQETVEGRATYGVLPIESSLVGPVAETHDLLYRAPLSITAETSIPIRHHLVAREQLAPTDVRVVRSHPVALEQCRELLRRLRGAKAIAAPTTADAAAQVAESEESGEAAIASDRAAALYGLHVIESDVGDHPEAFTRFVSVASHTRIDREHETWRTAFSFVTDHRAGALHGAIEPFARHGIDLVQLVSRPIPESPWSYRFDAVLTGHPLDPEIRVALGELRERSLTLRVFGSYPAGA